ncbi:histone-arginine methyltransferase CARMER-like [Sycon ciliatum]|uniref:histone-arginine methyltransferase CARMER-like n=1 Tax=Sycon ciliatum TaxID=27933 RepID=UPI0031F61EDB
MDDADVQAKISVFNVQLTLFDPSGKPVLDVQQGKDVRLVVEAADGGLNVSFKAGEKTVLEGRVSPSTTRIASGDVLHLLQLEQGTAIVRFADAVDSSQFATLIKRQVATASVFDERTEEASAKQYFQFYGYLCQQQNMMQDFTRTSTYQAAILQNGSDFYGKVVLDVGAGSGILSFFAAQAGARKVYAIEASSVAKYAKILVENNKMDNVIEVIHGQIEEVHIPEEVDIIISEPMGYMLFNERMLETFLHAKKWLKPSTGRIFPTQGDLYCAPFMDDMLSMEQFNKANFWCMTSFHGVDLSSLRSAAAEEYARQPVVDTFDVRILLARPNRHSVDFSTADEKDLHRIHFPVTFQVLSPGTVHGIAFWFDVAFIGSSATIWLSTAPHEPLTHWYQVRCLLKSPLLVRVGQTLSGSVTLVANNRQSYDVTIDLGVDGTTQRSSNCLDLKNPYFRYSGMQLQHTVQANNVSPTDTYWGADASSTGNTTGQPMATDHASAGAAAGSAGYVGGVRGAAPDAGAPLLANYTPQAAAAYGNTALASSGGTNGSVMSARVATPSMPGGGGGGASTYPVGQDPIHSQQQTTLASRFGLTSAGPSGVPVANSHPIIPSAASAASSSSFASNFQQTAVGHQAYNAAGQPMPAVFNGQALPQWQQQQQQQ